MRQKLHICRVLKEEHLPAGYERIAVFASGIDEDKKKAFSNAVDRAIHRGSLRNGEKFAHPPFCVGGKPENYHGGTFYLHPEDYARIHSELFEKPDLASDTSSKSADAGLQFEPALTALCEINNGIVLLNATLRDVVAAVHLVAEQLQKQNEPAGSWRDSNGEAMN
jgi:hypothetical protein